MAHDRLKNATLPQALSEVVADLADLFQKELRLAKAEISAKISTKLSAGIGNEWLRARIMRSDTKRKRPARAKARSSAP